MRSSVPPADAERHRQFLDRWKSRLPGPLKTLADGPHFTGDWATDGHGAYIELRGIPASWYEQLDRYLRALKEREPGFRILQLKTKLGGVRLYLGNVSDEERRKAMKFAQSLSRDERSGDAGAGMGTFNESPKAR